MASGRLGAADLSATTNTSIYTVPSAKLSTVNVSICNRNATAIAIRLAHIDGEIGDIANEDYIEYDTVVPANDTLERTGIVMAATHTLMAYSDTANVSVVAWGFEEDA